MGAFIPKEPAAPGRERSGREQHAQTARWMAQGKVESTE